MWKLELRSAINPADVRYRAYCLHGPRARAFAEIPHFLDRDGRTLLIASVVQRTFRDPFVNTTFICRMVRWYMDALGINAAYMHRDHAHPTSGNWADTYRSGLSLGLNEIKVSDLRQRFAGGHFEKPHEHDRLGRHRSRTVEAVVLRRQAVDPGQGIGRGRRKHVHEDGPRLRRPIEAG